MFASQRSRPFLHKWISAGEGGDIFKTLTCELERNWLIDYIWYTYNQRSLLMTQMTSLAVKQISSDVSVVGGLNRGDVLLRRTIKGVGVVGEWGEEVFSCTVSHCWQPDSPVWLPCWAGFWLGGVLSISSLERLLQDIHEVSELHTYPWCSSGES